jgi:hypothetical protein
MKTLSKKPRVKKNDIWRIELERIKANNPKQLLVTDDVIENAKSPNHLFHGEFTWEDGKAAIKWRRQEAEALIRRVYVIEPDFEERIPAFISLTPDRRDGGGYRAIDDVLKNENYMEQMTRDAQSGIDAWSERWKMLGALVARVRKAAGLKVTKTGRKAK